ncbi:MAG: YceI family protein [Cyclobacteriaceae bacterium]|nr:YceI family protein [Cyclobacteriaceae bacterium]
MKFAFLYHLCLFLAIAGCTKQPKGEMAKISDPENVSRKPEGTIYKIDTATSIVTWIGTNPTSRHNGIFKIRDGSVNVVKRDSMGSENQELKTYTTINNAQLTIDITSLDILNLKPDPEQYKELLKYLESEDFFHTEKFPDALFELISIREIEKDSTERINDEFTIIDPTHLIRGNLTMKGITKSIEFPARVDMRNRKLEASAKFNIDRTVWNINYMDETDLVARTKDGLIDHIVNVGFEILAYSQEP